MNIKKNTSKSTNNPRYSRDVVKNILWSALECKNYKFAKNTTNLWLESFPGDLEFQYNLAYILAIEEKYQESKQMLVELINKDPEFIKPYQLLIEIENNKDSHLYCEALACIRVLSGTYNKNSIIPEWSAVLLTAKQAFDNGLYEEAERIVQKTIGLDINSPLPSVLHMRIVAKGNDQRKQLNLSQVYRSRWPECITFSLIYARALLEVEGNNDGVEILDYAMTNDPARQVVERVWGDDNPFLSLWPSSLEIEFDIPIPADVSNKLGWNALPGSSLDTTNNESADEENSKQSELVEENSVNKSPRTSSRVTGRRQSGRKELPFTRNEKTINEKLQPIDDTFYRLEKKFKGVSSRLSRKDTRFPIYVILSVKSSLVNKYGEQTTSVIDTSLKKIGENVKNKKDWGSILFYPDDEECTESLGLEKIEELDPWSIKLALIDLESSLSKKGAMIGAVLIVGNEDVVPFHRLPNPTDDSDEEVLSDNPYSTLDANYFVPEWPVGRIPGDASSDAGILLSQLRIVINSHATNNQATPWWVNIDLSFDWWRQIQDYLNQRKYSKNNSSVGYTAAVWRRSSIAVFRPIGQGQDLLVSPPDASGNFEKNTFNNSNIGYFNLHGLMDSAEWYGQKDIYDTGSGPDYPIAIKASEITKNGSSPNVVFSEACYGGYIDGKKEQDSVALKFLSIGTPALIASSCIAYGSIASPLIGADLLGYLFFRGIKDGLTSGEAFVKAKIELVQEMNKRQGFLDGEDQKTLISFSLYGDPLSNISDYKLSNKNIGRYRNHPSVTTISDKNLEKDSNGQVDKHIIEDVKSLVEEYLPGLQYDNVYIKRANSIINDASINGLHNKTASQADKERILVTFKKQVKMPGNTHSHYARATLDSSGKIIKLAVSR